MKTIRKRGIKRQGVRIFRAGRFTRAAAVIAREVSLGLFLNGEKIVTIACAGIHLGELAVGYLRSEGIIGSRKDLKKIRVAGGSEPTVHLTTAVNQGPITEVPSIASSGARGKRKWEGILPEVPPSSSLTLTPQSILKMMDQLLAASEIHEITRGTHCSGLADESGIILAREDIGRHNTIDMLGGYMLMKDMNPSGKAVVTTGRVSAEIVAKVARMGIPAIVSHSAPTEKAVALCRDLGMTLIGYVRDGSFRVYAERKGHEVGK